MTTPRPKPAPRARRKPAPRPAVEVAAEKPIADAVQALDEELAVGIEDTGPARVVVAGSIVFTNEDDTPFGPWIGYQLAVEQGVLEPLKASV